MSLMLLPFVALPSHASEDTLYTPNMQKTPALRAGIIKAPYSISIPASFKEQKVCDHEELIAHSSFNTTLPLTSLYKALTTRTPL